MPLLPSHNHYTCLSLDEMSEPSTNEPDCVKAIQEPQPLTSSKLIHFICWEHSLPHKYVVASTPSANSVNVNIEIETTDIALSHLSTVVQLDFLWTLNGHAQTM